MLNEIFKSLKNLHGHSFLKKGIMMFLSNYYELKKDKEKFLEYFKIIDGDKDGRLSFKEIVQIYTYKVILTSLKNQEQFKKSKIFMILQIGTIPNKYIFWNILLSMLIIKNPSR